MGQILTVVSDDDGQGVLLAKRGIEGIFEEKNYRRLFPSRSKVAFRFKRIYFSYRLYRLLNKFRLGCHTAKEFKKHRHAFWNTLWAVNRILEPEFLKTKLSIEQTRMAFDEFEGYGSHAKKARRAIRNVTRAIWAAYRVGRKQDIERWTPNNFFKQKYGITVVGKIAKAKIRAAVAPLRDRLLAHSVD